MSTTIFAFLSLSLALFALGALKNWNKEKGQGLVTQTQVAGFLLWQGFDRWINYILYPVAIGTLGVIEGTVTMILITLVANTCYIVINNQTEEDWSFMSWMTNLRDNDSQLWPYRYAKLMKKLFLGKNIRCFGVSLLGFARKILQIKSMANTAGFLFLSVWKDSFYAINFLYHKQADLLNPKVASLYLVSHIICNLAWVPFAGGMAWVGKIVFDAYNALQ